MSWPVLALSPFHTEMVSLLTISAPTLQQRRVCFPLKNKENQLQQHFNSNEHWGKRKIQIWALLKEPGLWVKHNPGFYQITLIRWLIIGWVTPCYHQNQSPLLLYWLKQPVAIFSRSWLSAALVDAPAMSRLFSSGFCKCNSSAEDQAVGSFLSGLFPFFCPHPLLEVIYWPTKLKLSWLYRFNSLIIWKL